MTIRPAGERQLRHSQNALKSSRLVEELVRRSTLGPDDRVYEIGAGRGRITACLAARCREVIAVEQDERLVAILREHFAAVPHVAIHAADCRDFPPPIGPYKVFANIPFDITTPIIQGLTSGTSPPEDCYLIVQREAAERFAGVPRESLPALQLKPWFEPTITHHFARTDFEPAPRVEVALLRLRRRGRALLAPGEAAPYRDFLLVSFAASRPLKNGLHLGPLGKLSHRQMAALGIDPVFSPALIRFESWLALFRHYRARFDRHAWQELAKVARRLRLQREETDRARTVTRRTSVAVPPTRAAPRQTARQRSAAAPRAHRAGRGGG